ncbi:MAG TPA: GIY-YIG nuclease family protein, partial [Thermoplasmata archaeon]|nr:GIY-YIG nuclease family protein [Thermoplasmata archaeon]
MIDVTALPPNPGCYLFRNAEGHIIYIGKAKNLRKRAKSYFQKKEQDPKTGSLITVIDS